VFAQHVPMQARLLEFAAGNGGLVTRSQALALSRRHVVDDALDSGALRRLFPGVYVLAEADTDRRLMRRAALAYLPAAALSHLDALDLWGVGRPGARIHLTTARARPAVAHPTLVVHRLKDFCIEAPRVVIRDGLRVVRLERALLDSWPILPEAERRSPIITALRDRRTTPSRLLAPLDEGPRLRGAPEIRRLVTLVAAGCHSELELWGHDRVFSDSRLPPSQCQYPMQVGGRTAYLDRYFPAEQVGVELDGAAWHGDSGQRERDLRGDAMLSAMGILVVRYSHRRLMSEPDAVVEELQAILARRRRLLAAV